MNFQENYAGLSNEELLIIAADREDLMQQAALALDSEMVRRGLNDQQAQAKKRAVARLEMKEFRRRHPRAKSSKYFVAKINGWVMLALVVGVPLLCIAFVTLRLAPKDWEFAILAVSMGTFLALSMVQPWLRRTIRFWISLAVSCTVQLLLGYWIGVHVAPLSRGDLKGSAFLAIVPGYVVGSLLFLLLQRWHSRDGS